MRKQPLLLRAYQPEQPGVLVRLGIRGDDLRPVDVEPPEDLAERLLPKPVRDFRVRPEHPELRQQLAGPPEAQLVGSILGHPLRAIQSAPCPAERLDRDLAVVELALEPFSGTHELGRVWLLVGDRLGSHRAQDLAEIRVIKGDAIEERCNLLLVTLGAIGGRWAADRPTGVPDTAVTVAGVPVEGALAVDAAH